MRHPGHSSDSLRNQAVTVAGAAPIAIAATALVLGASASAQEAAPADVADAVVLDGITVTARKIEEPIQQVPFGITVFGAETIEQRRIVDTPTFARQTPGLNVFDAGVRSASNANIRGNGSFAPLSPDDTSVPLFIDGIPVPLRAFDQEFFDIEQIQVLRGPQNTTFGRNAQAGAISITTGEPTSQPLFQIGGEIGNLAFRRVSALASGPLTDTLAGRLSGQFDTRDGDIPNVLIGTDVRAEDLVNINGKLVWTPSDTTDVTLAGRYGFYDEQPTQGALLEDTDFPRLSLDTDLESETEVAGFGLTGRHDLPWATLTSVTGFQYYASDLFVDETDGFVFGAITGFPQAFFADPTVDTRDQTEEGFQYSQELRLTGELDNGTQWLAGFSFFRSDVDFDFTFIGPTFPPGTFSNEFSTTSYAGFGEVTVPLLDRLRGIVGFRFTHERKRLSGRFSDDTGTALVPSFSEERDLSFNLPTGRVALSYDFLPALTGYVSVSRGAKAGGFQLFDPDVAQGLPTDSFNSAFTWAYEAGVRGTLLDGRLDVGASAFFNDTKDEDISDFQFEPVFRTVTENVDTESYGLEVEAAYRPLSGLTLSGGLALIETEITGSDIAGVGVGNELPSTPSVSFNLGAEYLHPVSAFGADGDLFGRIDYAYIGSRTIDPQNTFDVDHYDIVNLRLGWDSDRVSVYGFVENVFDEVYQEAVLLGSFTPEGTPASFAIPGQPRRFGVGVRIRF